MSNLFFYASSSWNVIKSQASKLDLFSKKQKKMNFVFVKTVFYYLRE